MDPMIIRPSSRQRGWRGEDGAELGEEQVEKVQALYCMKGRIPGHCDPRPPDVTVLAPERHGLELKIPKDGAQGLELVAAQH